MTEHTHSAAENANNPRTLRHAAFAGRSGRQCEKILKRTQCFINAAAPIPDAETVFGNVAEFRPKNRSGNE